MNEQVAVKKYDNLGLRPGMATPAQLRLIEALWAQASRAETAQERHKTLQAFLQNRFHRSHITMVERELVQRVVKAISAMATQTHKEAVHAEQ